MFLNHAFGDNPEQQILLQIQGVFAQYERAMIKERMRRRHLFAARQGRRNWANPPCGFSYRPKTESTSQPLVINAAEAEVVRQLHRRLVEEELSSHTIEQWLVAHVPAQEGGRHPSAAGTEGRYCTIERRAIMAGLDRIAGATGRPLPALRCGASHKPPPQPRSRDAMHSLEFTFKREETMSHGDSPSVDRQRIG